PDGVLLDQAHDHLPFLSAGPGSSLEAFFRISNSSVCRPRSCSNSAIRACSWSRWVSPWKRAGRPWRTVSFQLASKDGLSRCSRHSSADERCPESSCRTTWALNPAVKFRRVRRGISYSFRGQYFLSYRSHRRGAAHTPAISAGLMMVRWHPEQREAYITRLTIAMPS